MKQRRPDIDWIIGESYEDAGDGHTFFHYAEGTSGDGRVWVGVAVMVDGSLEEIIDIENP